MRDSLVAPGFTADLPKRWAGRLPKNPWEYLVSVLIPHIATGAAGAMQRR